MKTNEFTIAGRLGKDAVVFNNEKNTKAMFSIAVNKGKEDNKMTAWLDITAWRPNDKKTDLDLLKKGKLLLFKGHFSVENKKVGEETKTTITLIADSWEPYSFEKKEDEEGK